MDKAVLFSRKIRYFCSKLDFDDSKRLEEKTAQRLIKAVECYRFFKSVLRLKFIQPIVERSCSRRFWFFFRNGYQYVWKTVISDLL